MHTRLVRRPDNGYLKRLIRDSRWPLRGEAILYVDETFQICSNLFSGLEKPRVNILGRHT